MSSSSWNFSDALAEAIRVKKCPLIGGLDPQLRFMPPYMVREIVSAYGKSFEAVGHLFYWFNRQVINVLAGIVPAVKPQRAFYECYGPDGDEAFCRTVAYAHKMGLLVIEDGKRNDGGDTADAYADGHIGQVPFFGDSDPAVLTHVESPTRVETA
ncbi:MAG: hypothetical protein ABSF55_03135 [Candidatus Staskawiczbacteria bacterium]|jgi:orotidine-5'-phosphate decarboxylase